MDGNAMISTIMGGYKERLDGKSSPPARTISRGAVLKQGLTRRYYLTIFFNNSFPLLLKPRISISRDI